MFSVVKSFGEVRKMQKLSIRDKVNLMHKNSFQEYSVLSNWKLYLSLEEERKIQTDYRIRKVHD